MSHLISLLVEDRPGTLMRITSLFARRGYNIESLAVGGTERMGVSRITIRVDSGQHDLQQVIKQMNKLVNVLRVLELVPGEAVERELALIRVAAKPEERGQLLALASVFQARVSDVESSSLLFEIAATPGEIDSFEELLRPHGIKEMGRTGALALGTAPKP